MSDEPEVLIAGEAIEVNDQASFNFKKLVIDNAIELAKVALKEKSTKEILVQPTHIIQAIRMINPETLANNLGKEFKIT